MIKPILFNTDMVRAILDGRKTVTRRKISSDIVNNCDMDTDGTLLSFQNCHGEFINPVKLCRYQIGDILYVRETWHKYTKRVGKGENCRLREFYGYKASIKNSEDASEKWKPSIHMPKEAARIFLKVTDVRVERLQDIDDKGAYEEGAGEKNVIYQIGGRVCEFVKIWQSTVEKKLINTYGWDANPWIWVIEFEQCRRPEGWD